MNPHVGSTWLNRCLDRIAGNGDFTNNTGRCFEPDLGTGWLSLGRLVNAWMIVVFNVIAGDL